MKRSSIILPIALLFASYTTSVLCMNKPEEKNDLPVRKLSDYKKYTLHGDEKTVEELMKNGISTKNSEGIENNNSKLAITLAYNLIMFPGCFANTSYAILNKLQPITNEDLIPFGTLCCCGKEEVDGYLKDSFYPSIFVQDNIKTLRELHPNNKVLNEKLLKIEKSLMFQKENKI